jgi:GTP pyrophosphokinase
MRQYELVERVRAYNPQADETLLNRAYVFGLKAHGAQRRHSGDPYFSHPIDVAGILTDLHLDDATIATALLHDTVEDTVATSTEIAELFGPEVAELVEGVTKLSRIEFSSEKVRQAENFRKLLLAMSNDIRVLLVKLADRLHNMRTLRYIPSAEKRLRIAQETMEIYAPLAGRIGMQEFRDELEDLAFAELNPDARDSIMRRLDFLREQNGDLVDRIATALRASIGESGVEARVSGREKRPYSIWKKMESKSISFEQLSDVIGFRIIVDSIEACYRALGIVHSAWPMVPGRFKDYVSTPKRNGYRSIHTAVIGPERQRIELQIRTEDMDDVAERGLAAHWSYKEGARLSDDHMAYRWVRELIEMLEHGDTPEEFLEHTKLEMFQDQVFCFSPKGDLISLPRGATPIDFAYAVHTEVGDTCVGCRINGRHMPLHTRLKTGDQVEIARSKAQTPSPTWENIVVTGKARSAVRRFVRQKQRDQYIRLGREIVERAFNAERRDFSEKGLSAALKLLPPAKIGESKPADLYAAVGQGNLTGRQVLEAVFPDIAAAAETRDNVVPLTAPRRARSGRPAVPIRGLIPGLAVHFGRCCHPLPGDRIVGIVTTGRGVTVHTIDCDTLEQFNETPERWLDVSWDSDELDDSSHVGRIVTVLSNRPGAMAALSTTIAKGQGNISNLKITDRSSDFFEIMVDIEVHNVRHLTNIIAALRANPTVNSVERARG